MGKTLMLGKIQFRKHREAYLGRRNGQCKGPEACEPAELEGKRWEMRTDDSRGRGAV